MLIGLTAKANTIPRPVFTFLSSICEGNLSLPQEFLSEFEAQRLKPIFEKVPSRVIIQPSNATESQQAQRKVITNTIVACFVVVKVIFGEVFNNEITC